MDLKHNVRTIYRVDAFDLDDFLQSHFGGNIEVNAAWEMGNDSSFSMTVVDDPLEDYEQEIIDNYVANENDYQHSTPRHLMQALAIQGIVEPGEYIIDICW